MFSFGSSFYIKNISKEKKSGLFLSYAITGIGVNDIISIIRYPQYSIKIPLNKYSRCLLEEKIINIKAQQDLYCVL